MTIWLVSDTHFGHASMLSFTNSDGSPVRTFSSVQEMDDHIVERWNAVVRPGDHVYHLGDVAIKKTALATVRRLNGRKRLVGGNHDIFDYKDYVVAGFEKIMGLRVLDRIVLSHIPLHQSSLERFRGNVHGHVHGGPSPSGPYLNVSVEALNYTPISLEDAAQRLDLAGGGVE